MTSKQFYLIFVAKRAFVFMTHGVNLAGCEIRLGEKKTRFDRLACYQLSDFYIC